MTSPSSLALYGAQINPATGIGIQGFSQAGASLISYGQNFATGTVRIYGDYQVSGSTFTLDYATTTYSGAPDANTPKALYFGPANANFNSGRSVIEIDSTGGFEAIGVSTAPTLIGMLPGSGTYYTFVDSGVFTVQYSSFTDMDESGIQLWNSGPFAINHSTFDYLGSAPIQRRNTVHIKWHHAIDHHAGRCDLWRQRRRAHQPLQLHDLGVEPGLYWINTQYSGGLAGNAYEQNDPGHHIQWSADIPPVGPQIAAVYVSSLSVTWGAVNSNNGYGVEASTGAWLNGFTGNVSSATTDGSAASLVIDGLAPDTTYFVRVGSLWADGTTSYALTMPQSTSTLTNPITGSRIDGVFLTSVTVAWPAYDVGSGTDTAEGYRLDASTMASFSPLAGSSITYTVALSTLAVMGLIPGDDLLLPCRSL